MTEINDTDKKNRLQYGISKTSGRLMFIDDVPNGLLCGCVCPRCGCLLEARNHGEIRIHHFAHYTPEKKSHIRMTALDRFLPDIAVKGLEILSDLAVMVLAVIMITTGWQFATTIGAMGTYVSIPTLSRFWKYFPIPVAGVAMLLFELEALYEHFKEICIKNPKEGKEVAS